MRGRYGARMPIRRGVSAIYHPDDVHIETNMGPLLGWYMAQFVSGRTVDPRVCNVGPLWDYSGTTNVVGADAMRVFDIAACTQGTTTGPLRDVCGTA
jgi:hypothetical protein